MIRALQRDDGRAKRLADLAAIFRMQFIPDPLEEDARAKKLAKQLGRCANGRPCKLSICPICVRTFRRAFILGAVAGIDELEMGPPLPIIEFSAVSVRNRYPRDCLNIIDLCKIQKLIRDQNKRAAFPLAIAGIEIALNKDGPAGDHPFWQAQAYGVVVGLEADAVESAIKREYPHAASMPKPFSLSESSNLAAALNFAIKPEPVRSDGLRNTRLKKTQLKEVVLWLSLYEPPVRYVLTGCHFNGNRLELKRGIRKRLKELALARDSSAN
jgi:hypothetical protein